MPRTAASNGVRPEFRALAVIKLGVPVTPQTINDFVGTGDYAAKYVSMLRNKGFVFTSNKDGRTVLTYTLTAEPADVDTYRNVQPKVKAIAVKAPVIKVAPVVLPQKKAFRDPTTGRFGKAPVTEEEALLNELFPATDGFGNNRNTGEASAFSVDLDFDEVVPTLEDLGLENYA